MENIHKTRDSRPWVSPFQRIVAVYDTESSLVELYEDSARGTAHGAVAWSLAHYAKTSPLVTKTRREGVRGIIQLKLGRAEPKIEPPRGSAGIESVVVSDDTIQITYIGKGGSAVGIAQCRGEASGVLESRVLEEGGGDGLCRARLTLPLLTKIRIGIDDTDTAGEGATWSLANEIGFAIEEQGGASYLDHTIVQLFPEVPSRTVNCTSTVLTFGVRPTELEAFISSLVVKLGMTSSSEETGIAVSRGIVTDPSLEQFSKKARSGIVDLFEAQLVAADSGVTLIPVTGHQGLIGALAAIPFAERHDEAISFEEYSDK